MALLTLPVLAGFFGTVALALGLTDRALDDAGLSAFHLLWNWPGLLPAVRLSVITGLASTAIAVILTLLIVASLSGTRAFSALRHLVSPLLAVPHAAAALGLAFLIAPSGWIARALSPWATGWTRPPDLLILNDPAGLSLILGLVAKELPFLLLMTLAALPQTDALRRQHVASSLGYGRISGFALTVLPALYAQIRLPVYAVLAYAMTSVEMAQILGPTLPPSLSAQISLWMMQPDPAQHAPAAAAAVVQLGLVLAAIGLWRLAEIAARRAMLARAFSGSRAIWLDRPALVLGLTASLVLSVGLFAGLAGLSLWSIAGLWPFPDAWPASVSLSVWARSATEMWGTVRTTVGLGLGATLISLALVLGCLEAEHRFVLRPGIGAMWLLYLPLLVPQIAFLPGLEVLVLRLGLTGGGVLVAAVHVVFVLPYVFLSLSGPYRAWDVRIATLGASLGASAARVFWQLRLPMLLGAVLTAFAVGFAVSVGQYLPTLIVGGGRIETLTTQAVALSSGGNRRLIGAFALLQLVLPALGFAAAIGLPALVFRNRRGMLAR